MSDIKLFRPDGDPVESECPMTSFQPILQQTQTDADNLLTAIVHELINGSADKRST